MVASKAPSFVLETYDSETLTKGLPLILEKIESECAGEKPSSNTGEILVINCEDFSSGENVYNLSEYFMFLCRKYGLLPNERSTLLSSIDQMIAVQLCLSERNKQERGEYDVEVSTVLQSNNDIINRKLSETNESDATETDIFTDYVNFMKYCNYVDLCDIFMAIQKHSDTDVDIAEKQFLFLGLPSGQTEVAMVKFLCRNKPVQRVEVEIPLENQQIDSLKVNFNDCCLEDVLKQTTDRTRNSPKSSVSITESHVQLVFLSYLELLVNSRSELALARSLNIPDRELTHQAFTDLKHEAKVKGMTMYQTAVSFVMKIRLGGKGYQPDVNCPIAQHVKGLGEYIDLIQKLQTFIEEEMNIRTACRKVLNVIKKEIVKSKESQLRLSSVDKVLQKLHDLVASVITKQENSSASSPDKPARDGGSMLGRKTLKVLRFIVDKMTSGMDYYKAQSLDYLCDGYSSQKTPVRFQSILSQFRSPEELEDSPEYNKSLPERLLEKRKSCQTPIYAKRYKSCMDWAEPLHDVNIKNKDDIQMTQSEVYVIPSKTLVQPASGTKSKLGLAKKVSESVHDKENVLNCDEPVIKATKEISEKPKAVDRIKGRKRQLDNKTSGQEKKKAKTQDKTCRRKLLPQVKGQQQLGKFFRV